MIDIKTGEILAMVNQPSYNPNSRESSSPYLHRNRAVTDVIEPGSVIKSITVAAALENGVDPNIRIDTNYVPKEGDGAPAEALGLIEIEDNGRGMDEEDLLDAVLQRVQQHHLGAQLVEH